MIVGIWWLFSFHSWKLYHFFDVLIFNGDESIDAPCLEKYFWRRASGWE